ncbi:larval cuticle protein LCP-17-like [Ostrinia nubilalis]|uniref:larval cuticle protein LCP-17-like n=1 Tax=Ostrinia nubilalis TaxID=29057 RepID=UPI0030823868
MKFLIVLAIVAAASADVSHVIKDEAYAPIVKSSFDIQPEGAFQYAYETGNGISEQASGVVKNPNSDEPSLEVNGAYKYTGPDGTPYQVTYVANEYGFQPQGSHLPVAPPVPEAIARSIAYNAAHATQGVAQGIAQGAARVVTAPARAAYAALG